MTEPLVDEPLRDLIYTWNAVDGKVRGPQVLLELGGTTVGGELIAETVWVAETESALLEAGLTQVGERLGFSWRDSAVARAEEQLRQDREGESRQMPTHIHLQDVTIWQGDSQSEWPLWRGPVSAIKGWYVSGPA